MGGEGDLLAAGRVGVIVGRDLGGLSPGLARRGVVAVPVSAAGLKIRAGFVPDFVVCDRQALQELARSFEWVPSPLIVVLSEKDDRLIAESLNTPATLVVVRADSDDETTERLLVALEQGIRTDKAHALGASVRSGRHRSE